MISAAKKRGRFVALEGGEGAGKSTQARKLEQALAALGVAVCVTREPGGTSGAELIRALLLDKRASWGPRAEALLFAAARADHVDHLIRPALAKGSWVISDRYVDSSRAYQACGFKPHEGAASDAEILALHAIGSQGLMPDVTLLLTISPDKAMERVRLRDVDIGDDRIGSRDTDYHRRVAQAFANIAQSEQDRVVCIDADGSADDVHCQIMHVLAPLLDRCDHHE